VDDSCVNGDRGGQAMMSTGENGVRPHWQAALKLTTAKGAISIVNGHFISSERGGGAQTAVDVEPRQWK
jgi:hypothetical protein